jgi:hypothetical protein
MIDKTGKFSSFVENISEAAASEPAIFAGTSPASLAETKRPPQGDPLFILVAGARLWKSWIYTQSRFR